MRYSDEKIREIAKKLRTPTYGHGAFGEPERHDPSPGDIQLAQILDEVLEWRKRYERDPD